MERRAKVLIGIIMIVFIVICAHRFFSYIVHQDYTLSVNTACNPAAQSCFVQDCDPEIDEDCDSTPYLKVEIQGSEAPKCLEEHTCEDFTCPITSSTCKITNCTDETIEDGERCEAVYTSNTQLYEETP